MKLIHLIASILSFLSISIASALPEGIEHNQTLDGIEAYTLTDNGLRILLMPNEGLPVATVMVTYEVGSRNEVTGTTGATHILEHMMFKGTERFNSAEGTDYSTTMERIGARSNATTYFDRTNYYATLPRQYIPLAIELEADRMRGLRIREEDLASEMTVVRNEFERGENNPVRTLIKEIYAAAFIAQPYGHPTIGWRSDIESTSVEKLRDFYDTFYWPENAVLTVIDGLDRDATLEAVKEFYGSVPAAPQPIPSVETTEPEQLGPRRLTIERTGQVGVVMVAYKVPEGTHEDWAALKLIEVIAGADQTGRLYRALEDKGKASATFTFAPQLRDPSLFMFAAYLTPDATHEETESIILEEIDRLIEEGVSEDELDRAKSVLRASTFYGRDGPYAIADEINDYIAMGDWTQYVRLPQAIEAVSASEIQAVAARHFKKRRSTTGWFVPRRDTPQTAGAGPAHGPSYYRDPAVYGPDTNTAGTEPSAAGGDAVAVPEVDFSSHMQKATVAGIEVIAVDMPITDVVSFVGSFAAGDTLSPNDAPSLAGLTAAMLDQGTTHNDRFAIAEQLETLGANLSFGTDAHSLEFSGRLLRDDAAAVMRLLAEQLREPAFDPEVFGTLKTRIKAGLLNAMDNPDYRAESAVSRLLYPEDHPNYTQPLDTMITELEQTTVEDIIGFHKAHYGPASMRLVFAGDVDFDQLVDAVEAAFGGWSGGVAYPDDYTEPQASTGRTDRVFISDKTSVAVRYGYYTGLQRTDEDYLPFMVGNYVLGSGFQSRLMTEVRKQKGLTYSIRSWHEGDILTRGHWTLSASFAPDMLEEGLAATDAVVERWHADGVTTEEVDDALQTLTGAYLVGLSTTGRVANQILSFMQRGFDPEYIDEYPKRLQEVTPDAVNAAIRNYVDPTHAAKVLAGTLETEETANASPDATAAPASEAATRRITVRLDTPDRAWRIEIKRIYRTQEGLFVVSQLSREAEMAAQVISTVSDQVEIPAADDLPVRHYVLGKTWDWGETGNYAFIESMDDFGTALEDAEVIYERE